jgi:hypothetical protein
LRDDASLSDGEEVHVLIRGQLVGVLADGVGVLGLERVWDIDDSAVELLSLLVL